MLHFIFITFNQAVMIIFTIAVLVAMILIAPGLARKVFNRHGNKIEAEAIVLSMSETGLHVNDQLQVILQMQIQPDKGRNFIAEINETIPINDLEKFSEGKRINVMYNPFNQKDVTLRKT